MDRRSLPGTTRYSHGHRYGRRHGASKQDHRCNGGAPHRFRGQMANPLRLKITGSNFRSGCAVTINGAFVPQTDRKGDTLVYAKGGDSLKVMLPKGLTVGNRRKS